MEIDPREFGKLEAEVEALRQELAEHKRESKEAQAKTQEKLDELIALANQGRGAYWAGMLLASGIGAGAVALIKHFFSP